jgi:hypothetical protein
MKLLIEEFENLLKTMLGKIKSGHKLLEKN